MFAETFWGLVDQRAETTPDAVALLDEHGVKLTFAELREQALSTAARLAELGVGPGTAVAWQLPTRISTVLTLCALARLGALQMPLLMMYRERELGALLAAGRPQLVLVPGQWRGTDYTALVRDTSARVGLRTEIVTAGPGGPAPHDPTAILPEPPAEAQQPRWAYATSGSSGVPKAALHNDRGVLAAAASVVARTGAGTRAGDVGCIAFPIGHLGGTQYLTITLLTGTPTLLVEAFDPARTLATFEQHGVTIIGGSTALYQTVLAERRRTGRHPVPALRLLTGGGAPLSAALYHELRAELGVEVAHCYGMTEALMVAVADPADGDELLATTDGKLIDGLHGRVVAPGGDAVLGPGEEGEMQVRGVVVTTGYTDPAHDAAAFTADGWLRTGDLVRMSATGHVAVTGRIKDVIIRKGENISALEIEELLLAEPEIAEAAVIGLPDAERGELVCAVVRPADPGARLTLGELTGRLRAAGLITRKLPERLEIVDAMPMTGLGKIAKNELGARFGASAAERRP
ncbi:class I adenylate-forming enzyme family protein [Amycolatopsis sp.]|uniref:class I adenylate-forming enzyme family protein n=1 Tax=Amycolatopsis sp. TaxID=37632 RepID=UPI002CC25399|nr:AMP-binding protein [Amycolatopsis sp.]HVV08181.1 AMP-binding protein [Amycolatopsis sp.]